MLTKLAFGILLGVGACVTYPEANPLPAPRDGFYRPPPKPGETITNSRMCECTVCFPRSCCEGPEDTAENAATCHDDYDFTDDEECGLAIKSCASRCTREVWRVTSAQSCDSKRPASCCG